MQTAKEKLSNMASAAKEHVDVYTAKVAEKAEKAGARTEEEKAIAQERRIAKEAEAKMELHQAKAHHAAQKLNSKQSHLHGHHRPLATAAPVAGTAGPHAVAGAQPGFYEPVAGGTHGNHPVGNAPPPAPMGGAKVPTYPLGGYPAGREYK